LKSTKKGRRDSRRAAGIIRPLAADDPRNIDHPSHKEHFLELARTLGRLEAQEEFERLHGNEGLSDGIAKTRNHD
jgi:hypothetical protein